MSDYFKTLPQGTKERYIEKLSGLGFTNVMSDDPYLNIKSSKVGVKSQFGLGRIDDITKWPTVDFGSVLRSWSRHSHYETPKSMQNVWRSSYQDTYNGKKIGFNPDKTIIDYFHGTAHVVPTHKSNRLARYKNPFNDRAREGFRYWLVEKPRPSHFGRYGTGSYKTVLGIGNAPRT